MSLDRVTREQMLALCGEICAEDGVDPRRTFRVGNRPKRCDANRYKSQRLCRQVLETLSLVWAEVPNDELLIDLQVVSVQPAPDSRRLAVEVRADVAASRFDRDQIESCLQAQAGRLRCAVAAAISRRRTPILVFRLLGPEPLDFQQKNGGKRDASR